MTLERFAHRVFVGVLVAFGAYVIGYYLLGAMGNPDRLFHDATIYYDATAVWLAGGNPWAVQPGGMYFAGLPPTLLLSLPLQPFGPGIAEPFWAIAGLVSGAVVMRRLHLAWWWAAFPPYWEGVLNGNPDTVLLALCVLGGGAVSAFVKPYAAPGLLAVGRWRAVLVAGIAGVVSLLVLPWGMFLGNLSTLRWVLEVQTLATSAWEEWPLAIAVAVALVSLGPRLGLGLLVPTLWPNAQLHYSLFSVPAVKDSAALALALSVPHLAAPGVIAYALVLRMRGMPLPLGSLGWSRGPVAGSGS